VLFGQKLILNHPSLMDEGEETRVLTTAKKKEKRESYTHQFHDMLILVGIEYL